MLILFQIVSCYFDFQEVSFHVKCQAGWTAVVFLSLVLLPTVISLCNELGEKSSEIPWNSPNPGNCNEEVARLRSIGPIVYSCMDSMVLQGSISDPHCTPHSTAFQDRRRGVGGCP